MKPELSIIIPCYNCEKTLEEAVASCFNQGLGESFEILLVDDTSTDSTRELMKKLAQEHKEIRLFYHDKNKGGGAARNTAVKNSQANSIFCLDSDDVLPENTLMKMYRMMKEKGCDGVTIHRSIKFNGDNIQNIERVDTSEYGEKAITLASLFDTTIKFQPIYVNFMYTRAAFEKLGGYPEKHGYDTQGFGWRFVCAGLKAYTCKDSEYLHRVNFKESYFLKEYNDGRSNYNWRDILLEHYYIFTQETLNFILSFDCKNFTINLMEELMLRKKILKDGYENELGRTHEPINVSQQKPVFVRRDSIRGYYYRVMHRIFKKIKQ